MDETTARWRMAHPISGGADPAADTPPVESPPAEPPPAEPPTPAPPPPAPTAEEQLAQIREENARLRGENATLRETRREPATPETPPPAADPLAAEYEAIERDFGAGKLDEREHTIRLGALGARAELARHAQEARQLEAHKRSEQAQQRSTQRIGTYMQRIPALGDARSPEFQRTLTAVDAVLEEHPEYTGREDPRAQALALERTFGPLDRSPHVDHREFERRRQPGGGGGGGTFAEEPAAPAKPKSYGEQVFDRLLPEFQKFFLDTRGSKEAAIRTLEHADEHLMRKQGRFR